MSETNQPEAAAVAPAAPAVAMHAPNVAVPAAPNPAPAPQSEEQALQAAEIAFYAAPPTPRDYQLPSHMAEMQGLPVDFAAEQELRAALHGAGVDNNLAASLYSTALLAAKQDLTPVSVAGEYVAGERSLRQAWGADFEANLKSANAEGRRLFDALPVSVRGDMSFAEYALVTGIANSAPIAKMLLARARTRSGSSKAGR